MNTNKINRNDPCPCGSGKKYKQCCQTLLETSQSKPNARLLESIPNLFKQAIKYQQLNELEKAERLYQQILDISPKQVDTLSNLGLLYQQTDRIDMAVNLLRQAARLEPSAKHYGNLGQALSGDEAIQLTEKAIALNPSDVLMHYNLGLIFLRVHRYKDAVACFEKVLSFNPQHEKALSNIGFCLMYQSKHHEAAAYLRRAIKINPLAELSYKRLLFCLCFDKKAFPETYLHEAHSLEQLWEKAAQPYQQWICTKPSKDQPLRVGFVSGDIGNHPVGYFLENIVSHIDKTHVELFVYSTRAESNHDELTKRIISSVNKWQTIRTLNDHQAAALIHNDAIHILIDLAGYTANTGISIFTWRPAPVQVSWLGYFASTGLKCMDYFIADPISVPQQNKSHFTEKVWYLPETRLCFTPPALDMNQDVLPAPVLKNGFITFGCFQNLSKLNDEILRTWAEILKSCPNSKLFLKNNQIADPIVKMELIENLNQLGIPENRILLETGSPRNQYLESYGKIDFILDTFPYPGGTTTCEALWMGVPTLTLAGNTLLERQGMAILSCVGLDDWITYSKDEYVQKAIIHALNRQKLSHLRSTLRQTMETSPLVDADSFARELENAFNGMWEETIH